VAAGGDGASAGVDRGDGAADCAGDIGNGDETGWEGGAAIGDSM